MLTSEKDATSALEGLGFTDLEARIYVDLLRHGPLTGYRVAHNVGKAVANTYKALEDLARRGIVASDDSGTRSYRALPYAELVSMLTADFAQRSQAAATTLASLGQHAPDDGVYRLQRDGAIFERARTMIEAARTIVFTDAFPMAAQALQPSLEDAARRGVRVIARVYAPIELDGVEVILPPGSDVTRDRWPGTWLSVSSDADATLIAHLAGDERTTGTWTQNPYISFTFFCGIASETAVAALRSLSVENPHCTLTDALAHIEPLLMANPPGRFELFSKMEKGTQPS